MIAGRFAACVVSFAVLAGVSGTEASAVLGGRTISVRSAPWVVSLRDEVAPGEAFNCTAVVLDSLHVLTAAHCFFNSSGLLARRSQLVVKAGVSNFRHARPKDHQQVRKVASIRFFPGYVWSAGVEPGAHAGSDVAVARLDRPFNLAGMDVRAVALPANGAQRPSGNDFLLAGFGREHASQDSSGALNVMTSKLVRFPYCSSARTLCGVSPASSSCPGDSGAGLVVSGSAPVTLVGVLVTGECARGGPSGYIDVAAKPILDFVEGSGGSTRPHQAPATRWAPSGWMSHPTFGKKGSTLPIVVSLPRSWITGTTASGLQNLWNPSTRAEVNASVIGSYSSQADFFTSILASGKAKYLRQSPDAVVHSRIVHLRAGRALELIVRLAVKLDGQWWHLSVENYNLFHDGVGYDVEYQGSWSNDAIDVPVWQRSASTIHFVANDA